MNILVLCHGNINRSAFVAALIRAARPTWTVTSAGLKTKDGRRASTKARAAASERGLSLEEHRSMVCTPDMVWAADIVLYMDGGNQRRLEALCCRMPSDRERHLLWSRCELLAKYGCLRRVPDPNYTSDPATLALMFKIAEDCTRKFLEKHP